MGIFVDQVNARFPLISNEATTILRATAHTLIVNSIKICNIGKEDIRVNLQLENLSDEPVFIVSSFPVVCANNINLEKGIYNTVDLIEVFGLQYLKYSLTPSISESLVCFSNGYSQDFSCVVTYTVLNETPLS